MPVPPWVRSLIVLLALPSASPAAAAPVRSPPAVAQSTSPDGPPPPTTPAELRRQSDASVDRNILSPTAETLGKGELTFNSYQLFLAGFTYGVTDDVQISATTLLPVIQDFPLVGLLAAKVRLRKGPKSVFSLQPTAFAVSVEGEGVLAGGIQALYDRVLDDEARMTLTLGASAFGVIGSTEGDVDFTDGGLFTLSAGLSARLGNIVKLMTELYVPAVYTQSGFDLGEEALLFNYGLRFFSRTIAVDLTFLRPIHPDVESGLIMGVPFLTFSARF